MYNPVEHDPIISRVSAEEGVPAGVLYGLMMTESGGRPRSGPKTDNFGKPLPETADGYFQFLPSTASEMGVSVGDFESEIRGAARYLKKLGGAENMEKALAKYGGHVKADPTSYITKVYDASKGWKGTSLTTGKPVGEMSASEAAEFLMRKEQDAANAPKPLTGDTSLDYAALREEATLGDMATTAGGSLVGSLAGGFVGSLAGPAGVLGGALAGGAAGATLTKYLTVRDRLKETRPDMTDEQIQDFAMHEGMLEGAEELVTGGALLGIGKMWDTYKAFRLGQKIKAGDPAARQLGIAKGTSESAPIDDWLAQSGKRPGFERPPGGIGQGAGLPIYRDAASTMRDYVTEQVKNLAGSYGNTGRIAEAFTLSRQAAADNVKKIVEPVYTKYSTGASGGLTLKIDMPSYSDIFKTADLKATKSVGLIDNKTMDILDRIRVLDKGLKTERPRTTMSIAEMMELRRSVDNLLDFDASGEISGDSKKFILKPLREALNKNIDTSLRAKGLTKAADEIAGANKTYSGFMKAVDTDLLIKIAEKSPDDVADYLGKSIGEYGVRELDKAIEAIAKYNPNFGPKQAEKFKNLVRNSYLRQFSGNPNKLASLGENLAVYKGKLDPDQYRTFKALFKGRPQDEALVARSAVAMHRVKQWTSTMDELLQMSSNPGSVSAAVGFGSMVGGPVGGFTGAMAANVLLAGLPKAMARAAVEGNAKARNKLSGVVGKVLRFKSAVELAEEGQDLVNWVVDYGDGNAD